jgi:hypothetical protein
MELPSSTLRDPSWNTGTAEIESLPGRRRREEAYPAMPTCSPGVATPGPPSGLTFIPAIGVSDAVVYERLEHSITSGMGCCPPNLGSPGVAQALIDTGSARSGAGMSNGRAIAV